MLAFGNEGNSGDAATLLEGIIFLLGGMVVLTILVALTKEIAGRLIAWLESHGLLEWLGGASFFLILFFLSKVSEGG